MNIEPIAHFCSPFTSKFGIPRQAGIVPELRGQIVFEPKYRNADALRGLEQFDYLWIIWGFSSRKEEGVGRKENSAMTFHPTVRPPLLGGNERRGVWATRSPFRPNGLGLSSVRIDRIENGVIHVLGADLMDGTPIYDIKPYLEYVDSHTGVRSGFVDERQWQRLEVVMPEELRELFAPDELKALLATLEQDPRPQYHDDPQRIYGMPFGGRDVRFRVEGQRLLVVQVTVC
ncbi:MAG: tRNA (N6-threonylcarbamoyladenosine(37)-N6)-methyltransferase TrmO [Prevotella sp.]|jgi:tRNA-Thr(GGU) m(6)t(6)A37 methyltransferase TsaA|nr:tRNA (N6-threonylcarbamoyladenosine(37)-N6)-methyltransferase TrmO [Prevotella sp.]